MLVECHLLYPSLPKRMLQNKYNEGYTLNFLNPFHINFQHLIDFCIQMMVYNGYCFLSMGTMYNEAEGVPFDRQNELVTHQNDSTHHSTVGTSTKNFTFNQGVSLVLNVCFNTTQNIIYSVKERDSRSLLWLFLSEKNTKTIINNTTMCKCDKVVTG